MDIAMLAGTLVRMAPGSVATGVRAISAVDLASLHHDEGSLVTDAVYRRRVEFASGRALLHSLLGVRGPIMVGPTRAPVLPRGVVGSLAHDRLVAVAAISHNADVTALGIDVEPTEPLSTDVARLILRQDEKTIDAHLAFTLKEAAYKAWSNSGGRMLNHHDVHLEIAADRFCATVLPDRRCIEGRFTTTDGWHLALVVITRDGGGQHPTERE